MSLGAWGLGRGSLRDLFLLVTGLLRSGVFLVYLFLFFRGGTCRRPQTTVMKTFSF